MAIDGDQKLHGLNSECLTSSNEEDVIVLSGRMEVCSNLKFLQTRRCLVRLTNNHLKYRIVNRISEPLNEAGDDIRWKTTAHDSSSMNISDIVGGHIMKSDPARKKGNSDDGVEKCAYLSIYAYPLHTKNALGVKHKQAKRVKKSLMFAINHCDTFRENINIAEKWRSAILWLVHNRGLPISIENIPNGITRQRNLLVLINPASGPGKALSIFQRYVAPVLGESDVNFKAMISKTANSALRFIKSAENISDNWDGIVIISGDGLVYEVLNGLMQRDDCEKAIKIPIGVIPGGSGNGLVHSILHADGEPNSANPALPAALHIVSGKHTELDLVKVTTHNGIFYSFLSLGWGLLADIDIESERLRMVGGARFKIWALVRIMALRKYAARLSFLPIPGYENMMKPNIQNIVPQIPRANTISFEPEIPNDFKPPNLPRSHSVQSTDSLNNSSSFETDEISNIETLESSIADVNENVNHARSNEWTTSNGGKCHSLLDDEIPKGWTVIEGEFIMVYSSQQTHIGVDAIFAPNAKFNDGIIWLLYVMADVSRTQILQFLLSLETGTHVNLPFVHMVPVKSFRLEPHGNEGRLTIDGELIDTGPIQADVLPSIARLMTRNKM